MKMTLSIKYGLNYLYFRLYFTTTMKDPHKQIAFSTDRLKLSQLKKSNLKELFRLRSTDEIVKYVDKPTDESIEQTQRFMEKINRGVNDQSWYYWGIILPENLKLIGTICIWAFNKNRTTAEIGFELHPDHQGKGYMTEAIGAIIDFGFKNLELEKITGYIHMHNTASIRLLEKNNFSYLNSEDHNTILALTNPNKL